MIDKAFAATLVCPENRMPLRLAAVDEIERLNRAIAAGTVQDRRGRGVRQPVQEALVREDRAVVYPIVQGIPMLLMDEGLTPPDGVIEA